jgi:hypothetical protein
MAMSETPEASTLNDWQRLGRHLRARTVDPIKSVPFVFFVFLGPVAFGALGVWVEIIRLAISTAGPKDFAPLITAISTYYPALGCSTALQLQLAKTTKGDKVLVSFGQLMFSIFLVTAIVVQFFWQDYPQTVFAVSFLSTIAAIWLWWITNADDPTFAATVDAATGGDVARDLRGTLNGFQV